MSFLNGYWCGAGDRLGGKGCLYITKLSDVDVPKLKKLIEKTVRQRRAATS